MGFRFRRSVKLFPGVRLNFSKSGVSTSLGVRGATMNFSKRGVRQTVGIPGTGISYSSITSSKQNRLSPAPPVAPVPAVRVASRFGIPATSPKRFWLGVAAGVLILYGFTAPLGFFLGFVLLLARSTMKPSAHLIEAECQRRLAQWSESRARLGDSSDVDEVRAVLKEFDDLELVTADAPGDHASLVGLAELLAFKAQSGGQLQAISGFESEVNNEPCYLFVDVLFDKRGPSDERGRLFLTADRVVFLGASLQSIQWKNILEMRRDRQVILIQRNDRQNPTVFVCDSLGDAMKVDFIGKEIAARGRMPTAT